jgi:hypothetical protein
MKFAVEVVFRLGFLSEDLQSDRSERKIFGKDDISNLKEKTVNEGFVKLEK